MPEGYKFEEYDVLQISNDGGASWDDYSSLRDASEGRYAEVKVDAHRAAGRRFRIYRRRMGVGVVYE